MKRRIENPKILLLDCNLEYKKGESQTNIEIMKEEDFSKILEMEEAYIKKTCDDIIKYSPDLVIIHITTKFCISNKLYMPPVS